ncbi:thioesterase family protein [Frankia sp. CN7]|uniref:Thioesterase family protein n=1 Tax=Frankia nepalensis TaxID=1836974 RepID=A0A937RNN2_9ACTN|nr:thioesterase family protein [Frankia nepalensis]MBL7515704.1 thioesterase family protein [Frankia nepalensis]MBL7633485.1 thioesterase family protein [Frankia nepalensis]
MGADAAPPSGPALAAGRPGGPAAAGPGHLAADPAVTAALTAGLGPDAKDLRGLSPFSSLAEVLAVLDLAGDATPPLPVRCLPSAHGGVLGAQLLAQQIVLAERLAPGRTTQTMHTVFPNPGRFDAPVDVDVEWLQAGRTYATLALTFRQDGRPISRGDVLLGAHERDFVRHEPARPDGWSGPDAAAPVDHPMLPWEVRVAPGPSPYGLDLWQRIPDAPADPALARALVAFTSEPLLVPRVTTAHADRGAVSLAPDQRLSAAILAQTITFAEEVDAREWHLVRIDSPHAGNGRVLGRGEVYRADGRLCAVFECVGMLRALAPKRAT